MQATQAEENKFKLEKKSSWFWSRFFSKFEINSEIQNSKIECREIRRRFGAVNKVRQLFYLVRDINSPIHQSTFFYWNIYSFIVLSELKSSKLFEIFRGHQNAFHSNLLLSGLPMNSRWIQNNYDSWNLDDIWRNRMNLSGLYDAVFISLSATYSLSKICNKYEKDW